jgi:hypothetical protein
MKRQKKERFTVLHWPGNSPNLYPNLTCCLFMKKKLKEDHTITSMPKLMEAFKKMWMRDMLWEYFKLSASIPRTLQMAIDQKGEMIKYW